MRYLVTGGAGFIGSALVRRAITDGHHILNVDKLTYAANLANLDQVSSSPRYNFLQADIADQSVMRRALSEFRPDMIFHLAAESHVDRSIDGPAQFIETNIVGTFALLEATRAYLNAGEAPAGFRFHHVSTDEVYGSLGKAGAFSERSPYQPNSPYSASKAASDMLVRAWAQTYDVPTTLSNCSNNYGPYQFPEKLIPVVIHAAQNEQPIPVYGTGANVRDWLHVEDHVDALLSIARRGRTGETYVIGGRAECTNLDLVKLICRHLDDQLPPPKCGARERLITFVTDRPGHDLRYAIDSRKLETELGWQPKHTLENGIAATIDWYLENEAWQDKIRQRGFDGSRLGLGAMDTAS